MVYRSNEDEFDGRPDKYEDFDLDDEEKRDPRYILGKKLLSLGKVHYRHIEHLPDWLIAGTMVSVIDAVRFGCRITAHDDSPTVLNREFSCDTYLACILSYDKLSLSLYHSLLLSCNNTPLYFLP